MKIITAADTKYFKFLKTLEKNIDTFFGQYPIIYDLGLKKNEKNALKSEIRKAPTVTSYSKFDSRGNIKATHKPMCILDCMEYQRKHDCLYIDSDILFTKKIIPQNFANADIAVAHRHPKEQTKRHFPNGLINTGVLFFCNNATVKSFIHLWSIECCKEGTTDQLALSNILEYYIELTQTAGIRKIEANSLKINILDPQIYNDCSLSTGKIVHFKNAGRSEKAFKTYKFYSRIINNKFISIQSYMFLRRINKTIKGLSKKHHSF